MPSLAARAAAPAPGLAVALVVAATATFLSEHYDAPVMLYALLLGMALNFVTEAPRSRVGIDLAAKGLLRVGVALLGLRIGWHQVSALGWGPVVMVVTLVAATILLSTLAARAMGFNPLFGFLSGGATAICGASAAMALSAALPPNARKEQATLFTVIGVSALSTTAMVLYPLIARAMGFDDHAAGVFIGATIHDVAQVVGAGYAISTDAGDTATIVKLLRVAMLLPVILVAGQISRRAAGAEGTERPPVLPWFVVAFVALVALNSLITLPAPVAEAGNLLSRWCLVTAIAAIGMKTRLGDLVQVGWKPVALMIGETALLVAMVLGWLSIAA
ncbi:YeiH family protein [Sphingobium estronivorans]|uniref:YeiH family protein n=1 Tax=Sphingobium estronivorans TaxID=1577690 RepID=UPI001238BB88|nr:putative sulfate exporter family transporter [Sphingobium estronivorans]